MNRVERAQEFNRTIKGQRQTLQETVPRLTQESVKMASGDASKGRAIAGSISAAASILSVRDWAAGMTTAPGDLVRAPDGKFVFMYSGKEPMTHSNPTFFPGASGVYYWAIIPNRKNGIPIYPSIQGIIVAVKKDELWYDILGENIYRWNATDWSDCSYAAGAAGVHQWVKVEDNV